MSEAGSELVLLSMETWKYPRMKLNRSAFLLVSPTRWFLSISTWRMVRMYLFTWTAPLPFTSKLYSCILLPDINLFHGPNKYVGAFCRIEKPDNSRSISFLVGFDSIYALLNKTNFTFPLNANYKRDLSIQYRGRYYLQKGLQMIRTIRVKLIFDHLS